MSKAMKCLVRLLLALITSTGLVTPAFAQFRDLDQSEASQPSTEDDELDLIELVPTDQSFDEPVGPIEEVTQETKPQLSLRKSDTKSKSEPIGLVPIPDANMEPLDQAAVSPTAEVAKLAAARPKLKTTPARTNPLLAFKKGM